MDESVYGVTHWVLMCVYVLVIEWVCEWCEFLDKYIDAINWTCVSEFCFTFFFTQTFTITAQLQAHTSMWYYSGTISLIIALQPLHSRFQLPFTVRCLLYCTVLYCNSTSPTSHIICLYLFIELILLLKVNVVVFCVPVMLYCLCYCYLVFGEVFSVL